MKYDLLDKDERDQMREAHRQKLVDELKALERAHYQAELDYRVASRLPVPDQARMDAARAAQASADATYNALRPDFDASTKGNG